MLAFGAGRHIDASHPVDLDLHPSAEVIESGGLPSGGRIDHHEPVARTFGRVARARPASDIDVDGGVVGDGARLEQRVEFRRVVFRPEDVVQMEVGGRVAHAPVEDDAGCRRLGGQDALRGRLVGKEPPVGGGHVGAGDHDIGGVLPST